MTPDEQTKRIRDQAAKKAYSKGEGPFPKLPGTDQLVDLKDILQEGAEDLGDKYRETMDRMQADPMFGTPETAHGPNLLRAGIEMAPEVAAGPIVDVKDLEEAVREKDIPLGLLAAAGLVPGVGDAVKVVGKKVLKGVRGLAKVPEEGLKVLKEGDEARSISKVGTEDAPESVEALQETGKKDAGDPKKVEVEGPRSTGIKGFNPEEFEEALDAMSDAKDVVRFISKTAENPSYRKIAERITPYIEDTTFVVARRSTRAPAAIHQGAARGYWRPGRQGEPDQIYVRSVEGGVDSGVNSQTVLHELLHASTTRRLHDGYLPENAGTELAKAVKELDDLKNKVGPEWKKLKGTVGPPRELSNDELIAWGYTNPEFQELLKTIKIDGKSGWNRFMEIVGKLLGLSPKEHNALSELLRVTERVLDSPLEDLPLRLNTAGKYDPKRVAPASLKEQTEDAAKRAIAEQ